MISVPVSQVVPVARRTDEAHLVLRSAAIDSDPESFKLPRASTLLGLSVAVSLSGPLVGGGLLVPGLDDVLLTLQSDSIVGKLTRRAERGQSSIASLAVSARALDVRTRLLMLELDGPEEFTVSARWKNWTGAPLYEAAIVSVAALYSFSDEMGAA